MSNLNEDLNNEVNQNVLESASLADYEEGATEYVPLKDMIRNQLSKILRQSDVKREINQILEYLPSRKRDIEMSTKYVKKEDLENIVRNAVIDSLTSQKMYNKQFEERLEKLEKVLWHLSHRVDTMSNDVRELSRILKSREEAAIRLGGGADYEAELQFMKSMQSSFKISAEEQQKVRQILEDINFEDKPSTSNGNKYVPPKSVEIGQRAAAQRQYDANMLMYRKSLASLELNNHWGPNRESEGKAFDQTEDEK